MILNGIKI